MKFAFTADIHLSRYGQDKLEDETNLPERLHSIKNALYEIADYCIANDIRVIVIGGDLLHGKSVIYAIAQEIMLEYFHKYNDFIVFYVIDGNHDLSGKGESVVSALRPLENVWNLHWVRFDKIKYLEKDDILFVPYSYDMQKIIKKSKAKVLISHFGLSEGVLNSGMSIISDLSVKHLRGKYELVLLGHYHKPQEIIEPNFSLYYVGSPIQLDWGEKNDEKRFLVVDSDTLDVQSIPIQNYKKHIELELTPESFDEVIELARKAKESGDHVKVVMKEIVDLTSVKGEFNIIDKTEQDITDRGITSSMSLQDKLQKYLEIRQIAQEKQNLYITAAQRSIEKCEV